MSCSLVIFIIANFFVVFFLFLFTFLGDKSFLFSFGFSSKHLGFFLNEIDYVIEIYGDYFCRE